MPAPIHEGDHVRFFSVQHNGQYIFVSEDKDSDGDRYVEAHPYADEPRNVFKAFRTDNGLFRFTNSATGHAMFVSQDKVNGDLAVQGHQPNFETRDLFALQDAGDGSSYNLWNPDTGTFVFLSNDRMGDDFVIEAHSPQELRNHFIVEPVPAP
ncbi:hypothetical protein SNA_15170 [Streptomyces natalensis ATCC 27448]|uniref:Ricin B lectin domain-containing protein n=1 Tax=Streptomyces natalensis ATCC 27448 TaxID=1240678 RepID=A0A0D7CNB7_9ACTN|nr:hypothetical protein SNA_15170 [Streptomyces natalensis ATCC 27448]